MTTTLNPYTPDAGDDGHDPAWRRDISAARAAVFHEIWELGETGTNTTLLTQLVLAAFDLDEAQIEAGTTIEDRAAEQMRTLSTRVEEKERQLTVAEDRIEQFGEDYTRLLQKVKSWAELARRIENVPRNNTGRLIKAIRKMEAVS